jgi:hypothetical protein
MKRFDFDICTLIIYDNYVINVIKERVHLEVHDVKFLEDVIRNELGDKHFIYIIVRIPILLIRLAIMLLIM